MFFRLLLYTVLLFNALPSLAQEVSWEEDYYKSNRSDDLQQIEEDWEGNIAMIGNTNGWGSKGKDILFWKINPGPNNNYTKNIARNRIGTKEDERAYTIVKTFDGGYLIGGYTSTKFEKVNRQNDPLLIKVDEQGEPLYWYEEIQALGSQENDAIHDLLIQEDGSIIAVGHKGNSVWVVKIERDGTILEKTIHGYLSKGLAVATNEKQELVITGERGNVLQKEIFITKIAFEGKVLKTIWDVKKIRIPKAQVNRGLDIVHLSKGGYAIIGEGINRYRERKMCLLTIEENYTRRKEPKVYFLGDKGEGGGTAISQTLNNNLLLTGYSNAHRRGARRNRGWVQLVNLKGESLWEESGVSYGNKQKDGLQDILQTSDGKIFAAGFTNSTEGLSEDAWVIQVNKKIPLPQATTPDLSLHNFQFFDANRNDTLDANERGYILFNVQNNGDQDAVNIKATINHSLIRGLDVPKKIVVGSIPAGQSKLVSIPLIGKADLVNFNVKMDVGLSANNLMVETPVSSHSFETERAPLPYLQITQLDSATINSSLFSRRKQIDITIKIQNVGKIIAKEVYFKFIYPYKVEAINTEVFDLGDIAVGESKEVLLSFKALSYYNRNHIQIRCVAIEEGHDLYFNQAYQIQLIDYYKDHSYRKSRSNPNQQKGKGPNGNMEPNSFPSFIAYIPNLYLSSPAIEERESLEKEFREPEIPIILQIECNKAIDQSKLQIKNTNDSLIHTNYDLTKIKIDSNFVDGEKFYYSTVYLRIPLKVGMNTIRLSYEYGKVRQPLKVNYNPIKGALHIYSIGIPYDSTQTNPLKYTTKDAADFAAIFQQQQGANTLFDTVHISIKNTPDATTEQNLRRLMKDISKGFHRIGKEKIQIKEEDVIRV